MRKLDLGKYKIPEKKFLKPAEDSNKINNAVSAKETSTHKKDDVIKKEKVKKNEKMGRPIIGDEPLTKSVTFLVTENELRQIDKKAGMIPRGGFLRETLKKGGIIN